jgi:hypothetical protein
VGDRTGRRGDHLEIEGHFSLQLDAGLPTWSWYEIGTYSAAEAESRVPPEQMLAIRVPHLALGIHCISMKYS